MQNAPESAPNGIKQRVSVVTAADAGYAPHAAAMLYSLLTNSSGSEIDVYFLHRGTMNAEVLSKLGETVKDAGGYWYPVAVEVSALPGIVELQSYPAEAWFRLILPTLLPSLDRVLWIDSDTLVLRSIHNLWATDLQGFMLGAVPNALSVRFRNHAQAVGVQSVDDAYFNTGVMLLDLARMRDEGIEEALRQCLEQNRGQVVWADQDVFNPVFAHRYLKLPLSWNVMSGVYYYAWENLQLHGLEQLRAAVAAPGIVHFTLPWLKPWRYESFHPYRDRYWEYRLAAGWGEPIFGYRPWRHRIGRRMPVFIRACIQALRVGQFRQLWPLFHVNLAKVFGVSK